MIKPKPTPEPAASQHPKTLTRSPLSSSPRQAAASPSRPPSPRSLLPAACCQRGLLCATAARPWSASAADRRHLCLLGFNAAGAYFFFLRPQRPSSSPMSESDWLESMNDVRLKPKLLRSLIRNNVPDEKRPFPDMSRLSAVLSCVETHGLLKESLHGPSADAERMESWKSAVDAWVDHSLSLVSSKSPDKCWAGIYLLGVTCRECGSDRFLASYPVWFQKLLSNIQPPSPSDSHLVKEATCTSLSDLFTRLAEILNVKKDAVSEISNVKKDAVSIAGKVIQPIMQLLREGGTDAVWLRVIDLLCTLITSFPSSIQRHYERVEAIVVSKIMSGECSGNRSKVMLKRVALCLSLLPKVRGDENSCSLMMEKLLISINAHLDEPFQGLEEDAKSSEKIMRQLVPPGKDPPPPLGGQSIPGESSWKTTNRLQELVVPRVSSMMQCCCMLLTNHYPVQVTIPARLLSALLALIRRVLMVDGSLRESLSPITTAMHQEHLCSELPVLHLNSLDLLIAIIKGFHSHLLPHEANVARLIMNYFPKATLHCLRIKVYTVVQILLISKGAGMAIYLSQEVINTVFADLNFRSHANGSGFSILHSPKATSEVLHRCSHTKRKHASGPSGEHQNGMNVVVNNVNKKAIVPLSVQIAALGALNALINVGGSLKPEYWRSDVDLLLIIVATNACDSGWAKEENSDIMTEVPSSEGNFQLAALKALLTSLLSPSHVRPPYLSQGLELFRKGKQVTGTNIATFCAHALLALEVLIHPRALPIVNSPASKSSNIDNGFCHHLSENIFPSSQNSSDLYNNWLGDGVEIEVDVNNREKHMEGVEQPVGVAREDYFVVSACELEAVEGNEEPIYNVDVEMACESRDENISAKIINNFVGNDMGTPGEDAAFSGDAITNVPDLNKDVITSTEVVYENENGTSSYDSSYDSDSPTLYSLLDSLPDPDSESE